MIYYYPVTEKVRTITGTRKKKFALSATESAINTASYWSGGSRTSYEVIDLETGKSFSPPAGSYPTFREEYTLKGLEIMVETGVFCGKPGTPRISYRPEHEAYVKSWLGIVGMTPETI